MTYVNTEQMARAASTAQSAANDMCRAAGTAEEAARSLRSLFEEGFGSPALELLELLRNQDRNLRHEDQQLRAELVAASEASLELVNIVTAERDSALAQNADLVALVERLNNFSNERIARAATLRSCIEKVLACEELVFNSDVVLVVSSELADDIRCALDSTPSQNLRDHDAETVEAAIKSCVIVECFGTPCISVRGLTQYAESVKAGK